jgi:hypothetical protein
MSVIGSRQDLRSALLPEIPGEAPADEFAAWEQIDAGRYMPRRIRGSFRGRELG